MTSEDGRRKMRWQRGSTTSCQITHARPTTTVAVRVYVQNRLVCCVAASGKSINISDPVSHCRRTGVTAAFFVRSREKSHKKTLHSEAHTQTLPHFKYSSANTSRCNSGKPYENPSQRWEFSFLPLSYSRYFKSAVQCRR